MGKGLLAALTLVGGTAAVIYFGGGIADVDGALILEVGDLPSTITPDTCASGAHEGFHGVDLRSDEAGAVRVIVAPDGARTVLVTPAGGQPLRFVASECRTFTADVEAQATTVSKRRNLRGTLDLDCTWGEVAVRGRVTFADCH